jgi:hypothetical protein
MSLGQIDHEAGVASERVGQAITKRVHHGDVMLAKQ